MHSLPEVYIPEIIFQPNKIIIYKADKEKIRIVSNSQNKKVIKMHKSIYAYNDISIYKTNHFRKSIGAEWIEKGKITLPCTSSLTSY